MDKAIYLDNAATTFPKPQIVYETMDKYLREECVNAGRGSYSLAKNAASLIDETRILLLDLINGSDRGNVIFSPSATIAINQVVRGLCWKDIQNVYVSPFEHNAIMRTLHSLRKEFEFRIHTIPFDNLSFKLDEEELKIMFSKNNPDVILMSHVSNVTGYILPISKCLDMGKQYNPINVLDCSQSLGLVEVNVQDNFKECDYIIFAGHKSLYGPFGVGGFISLSNKTKLKEVITGGTGSDSKNLDMPSDTSSFFEAGSYNMHAIAGLNASLKWLKEVTRDEIYEHKKRLTDIIVDELKDIDGIELYVPQNLDNHIGVVSFNLPDYNAEDVGTILNEDYNIGVRTGHHCAPLVGDFLGGLAVDGTVRVSVGYFTKEEEIHKFVERIESL